MKRLLFPVVVAASTLLPCMAEDDPAAKQFTVTPSATKDTLVNLGDEVLVAELTITQQNLAQPVELDVRGADRSMWRLEKTQVTRPTETVKLWYKPTSPDKHKGLLAIECADALLSGTTLSLSDACIDPANPPEITINPTSLPQMTTRVGTEVKDTVELSSKNCIDFVNIRITPAGTGFTINSTQLPKNFDAKTIISFKPLVEGTYTATITWSTMGGESKSLTVSGVATVGDPSDQDWATTFTWEKASPLTLLTEDFGQTDGQHNKTLKLTGWQNVVTVGNRPWWGYTDTNDKYAKATGYVSQQEESEPLEMWLVTPPLDFVNAASKLFTFRVMGNLMFEGHQTSLELYYIDTIPNEGMYRQKIDMEIPATNDLNGEWREFHLDLTGQNITDVFFMAFRFAGYSGNAHSVIYYIDDVSWGRTDVPMLSADSVSVVMTAQKDVPTISTPITVTTKNLEEPVALTIGGANASKFGLSTNSLPLAGGKFAVTFESDTEGVHEAYVKLASRGAADKFIPMAVLVKNSTGLDATVSEKVFVWATDATLRIQADEPHGISVYSIDGRCVWDGRTASAAIPVRQGTYLIKIDGHTIKMAVR